MYRPLGARWGYTLVELAVAVGISAVLVMAAPMLLTQVRKLGLGEESDLWLESLQREIILSLYDENSWQQTINDARNNAALSCLRVDADGQRNQCNPDQTSLIAVIQNNNLLYDSTNATNGLTLNGDPCDGFNPAAGAGNNDCPIRLEVSFRPVCLTDVNEATCLNPEPRIALRWLFNPGNANIRGPFAEQKYNVSFIRFIETATMTQACLSISGVFDGATGKCNLPALNSGCPAGQYLEGYTFDGSGNMIPSCANPNLGSCPSPKLFNGLDADGNPVCADECSL